ncbi:MAG TPA: hypothetical protein DEA55_04150 [Rhodospirillaceae bacterium]|nr:hypothetical protein [Rhodospirillaceae bacterium]
MGSLTSRPSAPPAQPQIVYVPAPTVTQTTTSSGTTNTSTSGSTPPPPSESGRRTSSLLQRERGRFGTIQTGFRGLLTAVTNAGQRKTLLGE